MDTVARYAEKFGVYDNMGRVLANSLGSEETTMYKMVAAYAMFANGGERVQPTLVDRVQDRYGNTIYRHDKRDLRGLRRSRHRLRPQPAHRVQPRAGDGRGDRISVTSMLRAWCSAAPRRA